MIKRLGKYYLPYKKLFAIDFLCAILSGVLELLFPITVNRVIDNILPQSDWPLIISVSIGLLLLYLFNMAMQYVVVYFGHILGINIETDMRRELFEHMQKQPFSYYDDKKTGKLLAKLTTDLNDVSEMTHHGPEDIFITLFTVVGAFLLMLNVHVPLAIVTFALVPIIGIAMFFFNKYMTKTNEGIFESLGEFNAGIEASIGGIRVVKAFANEAFEAKRFEGLNQLYKDAKTQYYKQMAISSSFNYITIRLISLISLFFGAYFVIRGELSYGEFVGFILLSNVFVRPLEKINTMLEIFPKGIAGFNRFQEEINQEPITQENRNAKAVASLKGDINYQNVSFQYNNSRQILSNIDISIKAGETVAFVGPSGSGKTTLCNLLPRFYDPSDGLITIDGKNIQDITIPSLRSQIGIVQQDVYMFPGTIRENIQYGKLDASEEEIIKAAKLANLEDVINNLPEGLDTLVGERGVKLSGGQKQRLSIARMFLKNPPILILDEATSALDTATEQMIQQSLDELSAGRTTMVIAHRLATIRDADRIIVVESGVIKENGSHSELYHNNGPYRRLYDAQFGE